MARKETEAPDDDGTGCVSFLLLALVFSPIVFILYRLDVPRLSFRSNLTTTLRLLPLIHLIRH